MRGFKYLTVVAIASMFASCEPFEEDSWTNNSIINTQWTAAEPETGRIPVGLQDCWLYMFPQEGNIPFYCYKIDEEKEEMDIPEGKYDALVLHDLKYLKGIGQRFETAKIEIPTTYNERGEREIKDNPQEMIYTARVQNISIDGDERQEQYIPMERVLKKINFIANIRDSGELVEKCIIDISGLAVEMNLHNFSITPGEEAVLAFPIRKQGRATACEGGYQTVYAGYANFLGVTGTNILYFTFTDSQGVERKLNLDISARLHYWNTEEVTVYIFVDAVAGTIRLDKWSNDSSDVTIDN